MGKKGSNPPPPSNAVKELITALEKLSSTGIIFYEHQNQVDDPGFCNGCEYLCTESFALHCKQLFNIQAVPSRWGRNYSDDYIRPQECIDKHGE